jgi:nucleoside-diphosphate-sugar epimerase
MSDHVLVVGATGVVGMAAMRHFAEREDCEVTAVSRRRPLDTFGARFQSVDLMDERACAEFARQLGSVTRVVYAALYERPGLIAGWLEPEQIETNRRMLVNLFDPLEAAATGLRHVSLLQGTKAYGAHVGRLEGPAREDRSERRDVPNFYWVQEDYLRAKQRGAAWSWSILRPQVIFGLSIGAAMNLIPAIGVYAALKRERGEALDYPGGIGPILEAVDADLLARAIDWAGFSSAARNQAFNVTNGDVFVWQNVWPTIADALGMEPGVHEPERLGESMPSRSAEWDAVRARHGLRSPGLEEFVGESFHYADFCMAHGAEASPPSPLVSTIKLREAGFVEVMDTEAMFRKWFARFQELKLIPPR